MDPLSISVSILSILGVGGVIAKSIKKVLSLQHAPNLVASLNNELEEVRLVVTATHNILRDSQAEITPNDSTVIESLEKALDTVKTRLLQLQELIEYRLISSISNSDIKINKIAWSRKRGNLKNLHDQLHTAKTSLSTALSLLSSRSAMNLQLEVSQIRFEGRDLRDFLQSTIPSIVNSQQRTERGLVELCRDVNSGRKNHESLDTTNCEIGTDRRHYRGIEIVSTHRSLVGRRFPCKIGCPCRCHLQSEWRSPPFLHHLLGALFVNYAGLPSISADCTYKLCQGHPESHIRFKYYFPRWVLARVVELMVQISKARGLWQCLKVAEVISDDADIFKYVALDSTDGVKRLLDSRKVSPFVVSNIGGVTPLLYAVQHTNWKVARVLLAAGSDPWAENDYHLNSHDNAWNIYFKNTGHVQQRLRIEIESMFPNPDFEDRGFNIWHQVVLGLRLVSLKDTLSRYAANGIDGRDASGLTPLSWAAARGDAEAVEFLLHNGASCETAANSGRSPLNFAATSRSSTCVSILLNHGADVTRQTMHGTTALHLAVCYNGVPEATVRLLVQAGADINGKNYDGRTPLIYAVDNMEDSMALLLLQMGACVHAQQKNGYNALCYAIRNNNTGLVSALLRRGADHTGNLEEHGPFLHLVAMHSGLRILRLLTKAHLARRNINERRKDGLTAFQVACNRSDVDSNWREAFWKFLMSVNINTEAIREIEDPMDLDTSEDEEFVDALED